MAHYIILALPLLTAACAWRIFVHLARSGRAVKRSMLGELAARTEWTHRIALAFAAMVPVVARADAALRAFHVELAKMRAAIEAAAERGETA